MTDRLHYKQRLKQHGLSLIAGRIATAREAIDQAQQAANQEEKSSAGDKYETGRAMGHLQKDMFARQLEEHTREMAVLHAVKVEAICSFAVSGAVLDCGELDFFIASGLGKQQVEGKTVLFLSPAAPLALQMRNKKPGDTILFNGKKMTIENIY